MKNEKLSEVVKAVALAPAWKLRPLTLTVSM